MNANELADEFETLLKECEEHPWGNFEILYHITATMLRQQQAEIKAFKLRELSDEEIWQIHDATNTNNWVIDFARAILKKASEK